MATKDREIAQEQWDRYTYASAKFHDDYVDTANRNEEYYLGAGLQYKQEDRAALEAAGRPVIEQNEIQAAVNRTTGLQINSRLDIDYRPRGSGATKEGADIINKVAKFITDDNKLKWLETDVFEDGLIRQRGYYDARIEYDENLTGDLKISVLDPSDVVPDPDANSYDPQDWRDVTILLWLTLDEIEQMYGKKKAREIVSRGISSQEADMHERMSFSGRRFEWIVEQSGVEYYLVLDRQHRRYEKTEVCITPEGDVHIKDLLSPQQVQNIVDQGGATTKLQKKRIRWTVSCADVLLHDDWSPYETFTVIPYFPYFRRGYTRGLVDHLTSPQDMLNKSLGKMLQAINTASNSGWIVEDGSLTTLEPDDLEEHGADDGLVVVYKKDAQPPQKITPNPIPTGHDRLIERAEEALKRMSGSEELDATSFNAESSGRAVQGRQYSMQLPIARALDNLAKTRHLLARKILEIIQGFYPEERVLLVSHPLDPKQQEEIVINQQTVDGVINDVTVGKYEVVPNEAPLTATFADSQWNEALVLKSLNINLPDDLMIELSRLREKREIIKRMEAAAAQPDPAREAETDLTVANAELKRAQALKAKAQEINDLIEAMYASVQSAGVIASTPTVAPLADTLLRSAGFEDQDQPPLVPGAPVPQGLPLAAAGAQGGQPLPPVTNPENPTTPAPAPEAPSPLEGVRGGIENQELQGNINGTI